MWRSVLLALFLLPGIAVAQDDSADRLIQEQQEQLEQAARRATQESWLAEIGDSIAQKIPAERRLKSNVTFGEGAGVVLIADKGLARGPRPRAADTLDRSAYPMDVRLRAGDPAYFTVHCYPSGCVFSDSPDFVRHGYAIVGKVFVIPGNGCIYSSGELNGLPSPLQFRPVHCLENGHLQPTVQLLQ